MDPQRYSKAFWTFSWAIGYRWSYLSRGLGPDNLQRSIPTSTMPWYYKTSPDVSRLHSTLDFITLLEYTHSVTVSIQVFPFSTIFIWWALVVEISISPYFFDATKLNPILLSHFFKLSVLLQFFYSITVYFFTVDELNEVSYPKIWLG